MINATATATTIEIAGSRGTTPANSVNDQKENTRDGGGDNESEMLDSDGAFQDSEQKIDSGKNASMDSSSVKTTTIHRSATTQSRTFEMEGQNISSLDQDSTPRSVVKDFRVFVATWNVGGKSPDYALDLEDFLHVDGPADIYVLGFQEIVPLSAGNVLVLEDNEPAARWIALISHALNKATRPNPGSNHTTHDLKPKLFHKPSMKNLSRNIKADGGLLKACNCETITSSSASNKMRSGSVSFRSTIDDLLSVTPMPYCLVASKQMVGLFLSVWARKELVQHIGHLGISCVGRGIMGYLGNKGCISISFTLHRTSFCFVCSHLASGEKEGDEVRRNSDVAEILKNSHFPRNCKNPGRYSPERIIDHDRILWLGDLNYRMALSYEETRTLLENNDWDALLEKDQLNMEREAGRVFSGWSEGKIGFAPTYKYSHNSDSYAGETVKSKKKRRTPAWCDRILWRGNGIEQLLYIRGESRFSDHRPVCAVFAIETEMKNKCMRLRKGFSYATGSILECEDCMPKRHSFGFI